MTRTVTALFDSRPEAEAAGARLAAHIKLESTRMLAKDTAAAVDGLKIDRNRAKVYREALQGGGHLLVAKVARGEDPKAIIQVITRSTGLPAPEVRPVEAQQSFEVAPSASDVRSREPPPRRPADEVRVPDAKPVAVPAVEESPVRIAEAEPAFTPATASAPPAQPDNGRQSRDELRVGDPQVIGGGSREARVAGQIPLEAGSSEPRHGTGRQLSYEEVEARGLLKDRTVEVVEMREEPVVSKEVFVREEVIVRKTVSERTETIRDTVRRTQIEVDELPAGDRGGR
jgi:hypothetical protein